MNASNAGSHHSSSPAASRHGSAVHWYSSLSEQSAHSGSESSVPSGYTGLTGLRAHSGSHISSVPSGYTGLTAMRIASAHSYGHGASERHQGVFARAYRSPAISSNLSVPSTPQAQTAPVSAPGSHVSGGNAAAPNSPWQASDGRPAPVHSPHTHACRHVYGLEAYLDGLGQTAGGQEPHPADAIEIDEQEQCVYSPPSVLRTPGSHAPSPPVRRFFNVHAQGWRQPMGAHVDYPSPTSPRQSPQFVEPEDPYVPVQDPLSGGSQQTRDWPTNLYVATAADAVPFRIGDDVRSQRHVRTRSGWADYMRGLDLRYDEPLNQTADTGVRSTEPTNQRENTGVRSTEPTNQRENTGVRSTEPTNQREDTGVRSTEPTNQRENTGVRSTEPTNQREDTGVRSTEPTNQREDTGVRRAEQIVANFDRDYARVMGPIRQLMQEIREDMNRYDRRREEWIRQRLMKGPSKWSRQDSEESSSKRPRRDSEEGPSKRFQQDSEGSSSKRSRRRLN